PDPRLFASVCVEYPNSGLVRLLLGLPKFGWLKTLKNSIRKRSRSVRVTGNCRCTPTSACEAANPRSTFRPKSPCCPGADVVNAARLKILPPGYCGPSSSSGTPALTFGRDASAVPPANEIAPRMSTGGADLANTNASSDQSLSSARVTLFDPAEGTRYVTPAVNAWRMSKSESARAASAPAAPAGGRSLTASVAGLWVEWGRVYAAVP